MAKLIKKGTLEDSEVTGATAVSEAPVRRTGIIDKDTFEARSEGQQIRERAQGQAEDILAQAKAQAEEITTKATEEAEQIRVQAKEEGYKEGRQQGASEVSEVVAQMAKRSQEFESQIVPQLRDLALKIARKVLGQELEFHPEAVVAIAKQALSEKARQRREIVLRVNPEDMAVLRENKAQLLEVLSRVKEIGFREDADVGRYGVIIETDAGVIDAQLETQLAVFEKVFKTLG